MGFSLMDILNTQSKATATGTVEQYTEIYLDPYEVIPGVNNFYSTENIEELADTFLMVGQQEPTVLGRVNGEFRIINGHRRNLANILNIERGHEEYKKVRYLYQDMTEAIYELNLLVGNAFNRELTAYEKTEQAKRLKEALIRAKKEDGLEIPGKLRDVLANLLNESGTNIARMECITNNATSEVKEEFKKGNIGITAAYEVSKLPEPEQKQIAEKVAAGEDIRAKEIALKVAERTAAKAAEDAEDAKRDAEKQAEQTEKEIEKANRKQEEAEEKAGEAEKAARQAKILREYVSSSVKNATAQAAEAVLKVSETDIPQDGWNRVDWAVYTLRGIMESADRVTEDELYTLQEILLAVNSKERQEHTTNEENQPVA